MRTEHEPSVHSISLRGFKSFADEQRLEIRPLTLLAGANSSGKSSALQPLLLLKQTLEATYDPGPLLLDGPHAKFSAANQLLTHFGVKGTAEEWEFGINVARGIGMRSTFRRRADEKIDLARMDYGTLTLRPEMTSRELEMLLPALKGRADTTWRVVRNRCFLDIEAEGLLLLSSWLLPLSPVIAEILRATIHVPGLRGNPLRTYPTTAVGQYFPGTFESYTASAVAMWQQTGSKALERLDNALRTLGLTSGIRARPVDATQVELLVGRLPVAKPADGNDLVNIADVGFGVSQILPVLVALFAAKPGQLVYIEQPELHLHPRAQRELAVVLSEAAQSGVRVVAETHSSILLLAIQTLVAQGKLAADQVKLHWFTRDAIGKTKVDSADIDQLGAYGDWPEDFDDVRAETEGRYLDAVEAKTLKRRKNAKK